MYCHVYLSDTGTRQSKLQQNTGSSATPAKKRKIEASWVVELEERRVEAEEKLSNAAIITAEASRTQAEAALIQANAGKMQAEAARIQAEAIKTQSQCILKVMDELLKKSKFLCVFLCFLLKC